jgi:hypothetical protein
MTSDACSICGRPLEEHDRHVRFVLPEPVLAVPAEERQARTWGNDVLMQVDGVGAFVRILLAVKLTGGHKLTYGAWLSVHPDRLRHAWEIWRTPAYSGLRLDGVLANTLPAWPSETYAKPMVAAVLDVDHVPYAVDSPDDFMRRVLREEWPHDMLPGIAVGDEDR